MATPGQFVEQAMLGGYREGQGIRDSRKQLEWHQQFQDKHNEIQGMIDNLTTRVSSMQDKNSPEYLKAKDELANALQMRDAHWGEDKHPSKLMELARGLGRDLHFPVKAKPVPVAPPVYGQPTMEINGEKVPTGAAYKIEGPQTPAQISSQKEADMLLSARPLTPAEQEPIKAAQSLAAIQSAMKNFDTLYPHSSPEERTSFLNYLVQQTYGATGSGNWTPLSGKINGQPITLWFDKKTRQVRTMSGGPVAPEVLDEFVPDQKTTDAVNKRADFDAFVKNYKLTHNGQDYPGTFESWIAQQGTIGRAGGNTLKFIPMTGQIQDLTTGKTYNENDTDNPPQVASTFKGINEYTAKKQAFQLKMTAMHGAQYNLTRPLSVFDTANGNAPTYATYADMQKQPGRYMPAGPASKAISEENLMQDIMGTSSLTRNAIVGMREDFPEDMKAKIALAMKSDDPHAMLDLLISSGALGSLTPDQQDFLIATRQLAENAMAMRNILGAGQGSEDMRTAIRDTLPTLLSPDKAYALRQLDAFDKTIARLHRGVPKVQLRTDLGGGGNVPTPTKGKVSIKKAKTLPEYKHMSDEQIRTAIESHGYTAVP